LPALPAFLDKHYEGFRETVFDPVERFQPDQGPALEHRRFTGLERTWSYDVYLTDTEANQLLNFYNDDAGAGTITITARHPRRNETRNVRFFGPPECEYIGGKEGWRASFVLRVLPGQEPL
jgi:hypothetical protein